MGDLNKPNVTVKTRIQQPAEKVWQLWTTPDHITKWNFASDDWHCPEAENDLQTGGIFRSRMEAKDGSMGFDFSGVYDKVVPSKLITYTMEDGRKVVVTFTGDQNTTTVTERFETEGTHSIEEQRDGWQSIMDNFKKYAESID